MARSSTISSTPPMSASWSRPTSSRKNTPATTNAARRTVGPRAIGQADAHGFDDAQGPAHGHLFGLDPDADAGASHRFGAAAILGGRVPAVLPSAVLPHPWPPRAPDRRARERATGTVLLRPTLLFR